MDNTKQGQDERVPRAALEEFVLVRDSGERNMFDRLGVRQMALRRGYDSLAVLASSRKDYGYLLANFARLCSTYGID